MAVRRPHVRSAPVRALEKATSKPALTYVAWSWPGRASALDLAADEEPFSPPFDPYDSFGIEVVKVSIRAVAAFSVGTDDEVVVRFYDNSGEFASLRLPDAGGFAGSAMAISYQTLSDYFYVSAESTDETGDPIVLSLTAEMWYRRGYGPFPG